MHYTLLFENIECILACHTSNTNDSYLQPDKEIAVTLAYDKTTVTLAYDKTTDNFTFPNELYRVSLLPHRHLYSSDL
jgi:hypothetical protein